MSVLAFEVPDTVAHEYQVLPDAQKRQFDFECVFRLSQYSKSSADLPNLDSILNKAQAQAKRNGMNETILKDIMDDLGHAI